MRTLVKRHPWTVGVGLPLLLLGVLALSFGLLTNEATADPPQEQLAGVAAPAEPKTRPGIVVVYYPFEDLLGTMEHQDGWYITDSETEFESLLSQYADDADFAGTLVWDDGTSAIAHPPTERGSVHVRTVVFDIDTLLWWRQEEFTPGFLLDPPLILDDVPDESEAVFDMKLWQREGEDRVGVYHMRVRAADGAVSARRRLSPVEPGPSDHQSRGFWWPWACCPSQAIWCNLFHTLFPWWCPNCVACVADCWDGGSNPCHSCGLCGFSDVLCHIVPLAHCP